MKCAVILKKGLKGIPLWILDFLLRENFFCETFHKLYQKDLPSLLFSTVENLS